jgi:hypothetical protein
MSLLRRTIALAAVVFVGCATGTGPGLGLIQDEYVRVLIGDEPLPARVGSETWIADTIRFHEGGGWSRVAVVRLHAEGAPTEPVRREMDGFVTRIDDAIVLDFECNDVIILASCVAPDTLEASATGLIRRANQYGAAPAEQGDPVFRYEPVGP